MNYYLKEINDDFTISYFDLQSFDQSLFVSELLPTLTFPKKMIKTYSLHPFLLMEPNKRSKLCIRKIKSFLKNTLYKKMCKEEQKIINKTKNLFSSFQLKIGNSCEIATLLFYISRYKNFNIYFSAEPNWKKLKEFYLDNIKEQINLEFQTTKTKLYWKYYLKLINIYFDYCTPINKNLKFNLNTLKNIILPATKDPHNKLVIEMIIKWKEFLKEIDVEKNIDDVDYFNSIFNKEKLENEFKEQILDKYDYVLVKCAFKSMKYKDEADLYRYRNFLIYKNRSLLDIISVHENVKESNFSRFEVYGIKCKSQRK